MKRAVLACSVLLSAACSFQMQAKSSAAGSGSSASEPGSARPHKHKPRKGGKTYRASFHESGSVHAEIDWQGRSGRLCRAVTPFKFVGTAKLAGTAQLKDGKLSAQGRADASGKATGGEVTTPGCEAPRAPVPKTPPAVPVSHPEKPEPPPRIKPKPGDIGKGGTMKPDPSKVAPPATPTPPVTPTPAELEKPIDPPKEPPGNVFGYEKPVLGCFEGQVFPLAQDTQQLPADYGKLTPVSVLYACEWDIAPRAWDQGFPGIAERFEWFAIRYAGAFRVAEAGEYGFRLSSDDGSKLIVDGKVVIDNDKQHPPQEVSGKVQLTAGDHQMVLEYFQGPRFHINLQLWTTPPGKPEELFTVR
jgi:hypothetical protein